MHDSRNLNQTPAPAAAARPGTLPSDAELVHAVRRGDRRAFVEIVARHQAMVCGIALGILGDFAASEDAAQEAFLTAWRKFQELREPEKLRGWLGQIARNAALGHLRRRREHEDVDTTPGLVDTAPPPDEATASDEEAALVRQSLEQLPETYRLPLILYYREGQSVRAVAQALELSEDAVKQRLARGREMLRERMAGLVENVLTRTGPSAMFTVAIAVAIGALAAPAVVSGAVFASAQVAATGAATTSTSSSVVTLMSTSKTLLVAAAVVAALCVPVGYHLLPPDAPPAEAKTVARVTPSASVTVAPKAAPSFESSVLFAEWRQLHEAHGTNSSAMPALLKAINDLKDPVRRRAFQTALIAEWVQVDPAGGLKYFLEKGRSESLRRQFFDEWMALDARSAVDALMASGKPGEELSRDALTDIAKRVPERVPDIAARLPKSENHWDSQVRDAFAILAEDNLTSARKSAEGLTGPSREQALAGVARAWAKSDLDSTIAWAKALPDTASRDEILRTALTGKATVDPVAALDLLDLVPPGGSQMFFASTAGARVLTEAAQTDFDATIRWLAEHPKQMGHEDLMGLAGAVTSRLNQDAAEFLTARLNDGSLTAILPAIDSALLNGSAGQRARIWDWIKEQPSNDALQSLRSSVLYSAGYQDPGLALKFAADLPNTPAGDRETQDIAQSLLNGGQMLYRLDQFLAQSPARLQQPLLSQAFEFLRGDNLGDPRQWLGRLSQLPEDGQAKGTLSLARAWAQQTPEQAIGWAASLPAGDTRTATANAVVTTWASNDPNGAAAWINALPPGRERDRFTTSLVTTIAQTLPYDAWDWALSITDATQRVRAAAEALSTIARRDPALARQWIETSSFTDEAKTTLRAAIAGNKQSPRN